MLLISPKLWQETLLRYKHKGSVLQHNLVELVALLSAQNMRSLLLKCNYFIITKHPSLNPTFSTSSVSMPFQPHVITFTNSIPSLLSSFLNLKLVVCPLYSPCRIFVSHNFIFCFNVPKFTGSEYKMLILSTHQ